MVLRPNFKVGLLAEDLELHLSLVFSWSKFARFWRDLCQKRCNTGTTGNDDVVWGMMPPRVKTH
jgi:hypothetical protein